MRDLTPYALTLALLVPYSALADRASGGTGITKWLDDRGLLPGPGWLYGAPFLALACWLVRPELIWIVPGWAFWRCLGWKFLFGGSLNPKTPGATVATFFRHCLALAVVPGAVWGAHLALWSTLAAMVVFAAVATALADWLGDADAMKDAPNARVEMARGAVFGALIGALEIQRMMETAHG